MFQLTRVFSLVLLDAATHLRQNPLRASNSFVFSLFFLNFQRRDSMPSRILFIAVLCLANATSVSARDLFVNNVDGDDLRDGSSPTVTGTRGGPCRTIMRALQLARNGDHVILAQAGQPYRESITLQAEPHSGNPGRPFMIMGNGAILDGSVPVPSSSTRNKLFESQFSIKNRIF